MRKYEYSKEIADIVKKFLEDDEWHYLFNEEMGVFHFDLNIRSKIQKIKYVIDVREDEIIIYGFSPIVADPDDSEIMRQMAEFICRANYGLKNGCFEFDFSDGEIRFKSFIDCDNQLPSGEVIENSINCIAAMYKRYAAGFADIIFRDASAIDAIKKCEKTTEEELHKALEEVLGDDMTDGTLEELLTRLVSDRDVSDDGAEEDGKTGDKSEEPHIKMDLFGTEGGEA